MFTDELLIHLIRTISQDIIYRLIPVNMIATRIVDLFIRLEFLIRGFFVRQILCGRTLARLFYYRCGRMQRLFRQSNLTSLFCRTMHSFLNTVDPLWLEEQFFQLVEIVLSTEAADSVLLIFTIFFFFY